MSDEQIPDTAAAGDRSRPPLLSAIFSTRAATELHGAESRTELHLNEEHVSALIALRAKEQESDDRQSERESGERKEARRQAYVLSLVFVLAAIIAVVGITVFLVMYGESGLLGYILSGIGGIIAGAFGGYGYANRRR